MTFQRISQIFEKALDKKSFIRLCLISGFVVVLDQVTKHIIKSSVQMYESIPVIAETNTSKLLLPSSKDNCPPELKGFPALELYMNPILLLYTRLYLRCTINHHKFKMTNDTSH